MEAAWPSRSGQNATCSIASSVRAFSSSGACIGLPPGPLDLSVRRLGELGDLAEQLDGRVRVVLVLEPRPRLIESSEQLGGAVERIGGGTHAARSAATRAGVPLTSRAASGDA